VRCYDSGGYEDFVDYNAEPPVPLAPDDALFSDALLRKAGRKRPPTGGIRGGLTES